MVVVAACTGVITWFHNSESHANIDDRSQVEAYINQWINRQVNLPTDIGMFTTNGDSLDAYFPRETFKIIRYVDKEGCTSCRLHLNSYPDLLSELSDSAQCNVGFVCIINPADRDEIRRILRRDNFAKLTMWIDDTDTLNTINQFPEIEALQTFLLDSNNRVLAIGDPATNPRVMRLFTQILTNDTINSHRMPYTELQIAYEEINLGEVAATDSIRKSICIKNIGQYDFVLDKIVTSCDCTSASLSESTIRSGESAILQIKFSESEAIGNFYRTIEIFGNIKNELSIEITGTVI